MAQARSTWSIVKTDPAFLLGLIATGIFYSIIWQPAMRETVLAKYTSEHAVEYVIVTLFFWGMIDIFFKLSTFPREFAAARFDWVPARTGREPVAKAAELLERIRQLSGRLVDSCAGRRVTSALSYVVERGSAEDYREHLQYLAETDDQEMHTKYTVLRFVVAVTPILGFLGTVVHFGAAIGGFSFDDMDAKLPEIVGGMGTAFNTTSVALATAMTMMFAMFLCERIDRSILAMIDRLIDRELMHRFESKDPGLTPFLSVIESANREALNAIVSMLAEQNRLCAQAFSSLFESFQNRRQEELAHEQAAFDAMRQQHEQREGVRDEQLRQLIAAVDTRQDQHWMQIQASLDKAMVFRGDIHELLAALHSISRGEGRLIELQTSLSDNLRVLQETSQIDSALHGLTAAIHLMTSRNRPIGLSDSAAA